MSARETTVLILKTLCMYLVTPQEKRKQEILAKRFLSTVIELNNAGVLKQEKHSLDGVWYYLDMGIFKLEWIDMEAGDDPYVSKMHNALQKLLDSLV